MKKSVVLATALVILLIPGVLLAQARWVSKTMCMETCAKAMELTEEQHGKLEELKLEHQVASIQLGAELKVLHLKMEQELSKDDPSSKVLGKLVSQISAAQEELQKKEIDHLLQLKKILKPEQWKKIRKCSGGMGGHGIRLMDCMGTECSEMGGHAPMGMFFAGKGQCGAGKCVSMDKGCHCKCCAQMMGGSCCSKGRKGCSPGTSSGKDIEHRCIEIKSGK
jgi:Spy/CpxP family protein refolding chaperone